MHREWIDWCKNWLISIGLPESMLGEDVHPQDKLSHYSRGTTDITFQFPFGEQELWGIACRGDFDLSQHQKTLENQWRFSTSLQNPSTFRM